MSTTESIEVMLFQRAAGCLTSDDLERLVNECGRSVGIASNAAAVAQGLALLFAYDGSPDVHPGAGNFQSASSVSALLMHFAETFERVASLTSLYEIAVAERGGREAQRISAVYREAGQSS